jgi:hypothetical protein
MKLASKERIGSQVKKHYDEARTPYARVLEAEEVSRQQKQKLRRQSHRLNPAQLKREISRLQVELLESVEKKDGQRLQAKAQRAQDRRSGQGAEGGNERTLV